MNLAFKAGLLAAAALVGGCSSANAKHESGDCPVCHKPVGDGPEVRVIRSGDSGPGTRYRCFVCPIMQGETGDAWTMRVVSGLDGNWVTFHVDRGRVTADPSTAVVLALKVGPGAECLDVHRVFADEGEFRRYVGAHAAVKDAQPRRLEEVMAEYGR